jgi:hypothetical protein
MAAILARITGVSDFVYRKMHAPPSQCGKAANGAATSNTRHRGAVGIILLSIMPPASRLGV